MKKRQNARKEDYLYPQASSSRSLASSRYGDMVFTSDEDDWAGTAALSANALQVNAKLFIAVALSK
jgi:hypothetical protein